MAKVRKFGDHLTRGGVELRRLLDSLDLSVPKFCELHGLDRIQVQRMLLGQRERIGVEFAAAIERATDGQIPMIWWTETASPPEGDETQERDATDEDDSVDDTGPVVRPSVHPEASTGTDQPVPVPHRTR